MRNSLIKVFSIITRPELLFVKTLRKMAFFPFAIRLEFDAVERPNYAYCLLQAAREAKALGIKKISAIEFGVAGGSGIMVLEKLSIEIEKMTGVKISVYGFDLKKGLPMPKDYRDLPYVWKTGFYKMNYKKLASRLNKTKLVLGDVKKTVPKFITTKIDPVGFVAFDLDYYSSTKEALSLFEASEEKLLPRVFCYFDDIIGPDEELHSSWVGELLAIREFNKRHKSKKISKINGLSYKRKIKNAWNEQVFVLHSFRHKLYCKYVYPEENRQLEIS